MLKHLDGKPISGRLVYRSSDRSFDTELRPQGSFSSLLVNDVQIEVDEDGRLIYVWGYCPHESWAPARFDPPAAKPGLLQYVDGPLVPGVSKQLNAGNRWPVSYDPSSQWLCVGDQSIQGEMVAFAPGAVAAVREGDLAGLWLHPNVRG